MSWKKFLKNMILMTSQQKTETNWPNLWLEQIARNQQMNGQLQVESLRYEELIDDWLEFTVLEAGQRGPALKSRLVGCTDKKKKTSQSRISESGRWSQLFQGYGETLFHQSCSGCVLLEIFSIYPSKAKKH